MMKQRQYDVDVLASFVRQGRDSDAVSYLAGLSASDEQANKLYMNVRGLKPAEQKDVLGKYLKTGQLYSASGNLRQRGGKKVYPLSQVDRNGECSANLLVVKNHSMLEMADAVGELEKQRRLDSLDVVALQPKSTFEKYLKENIGDLDSMRLAEAGHDLIVVRYASVKSIPLFLLGSKNYCADVAKIKRRMGLKGYSNLAGIVDEESRNALSGEFRNQGFTLV